MKATEETEFRVGFADNFGTVAEVNFWPEDEDNDATIQVALGIGSCWARGYPTPSAARQMAAALLDAADRMES
jgi:hypothetical protein